MERGDGRPPADRGAVSGKDEVRAPRAVGAFRVEEDEADGLSSVPPPGPAIPVTDTATSAPRRSRAPAAIAAAVSADTAPCRASVSSGHAELAGLDVVGVGHDRAGEDVARARDRGQPRGDHAARARLCGREPEPALPAEVEDELLDAPLVAAEEVPLERLDEPSR